MTNYIAGSLASIINSAITQSIFPSKAKEASALPGGKSGNDKHTFSHYRLVSVLSKFSTIIELSIFDIAVCTHEFLSDFMGAYREHYGIQHVLIRLLEEWRANLDQNKIIKEILIAFLMAF